MERLSSSGHRGGSDAAVTTLGDVFTEVMDRTTVGAPARRDEGNLKVAWRWQHEWRIMEVSTRPGAVV